jgi:hypothetical protein
MRVNGDFRGGVFGRGVLHRSAIGALSDQFALAFASPHHCERGEAISMQGESGDCFVARILAMTDGAGDRPIASDIGCRNTLSDIIVPMPTQVTRIPGPTMTQP